MGFDADSLFLKIFEEPSFRSQIVGSLHLLSHAGSVEVKISALLIIDKLISFIYYIIISIKS